MAEGAEGKARLRVLGGFEVLSPAGSPVTVSGRKTQGLLTILALSPGLAASRDRLAGLLWSDRGDEQARNSLRQALVALRKELGEGGLDFIEAEREQVRLLPERVSVDVVEVTRLASQGRSGEAAALYGGALLDGIHVRDEAFEEWASGERQRLADLAFEVHEGAYAAANGSKRLTAARKLLALDPMREAAHRAVIQALAAAGEPDQALRQYGACRDILARELGTDPSVETERLRAMIAAGDGPAPTIRQPDPTGVRSDANAQTSIAVIPLANLSGNSDQEFFATGVTEDLTAELARYRHLKVLGQRTFGTLSALPSDLPAFGRRHGVDFVIDGSVRWSASRVRVSVNLIDTDSGAHVWADHFDRELDDILAVQDAIVAAVVSRLTFNIDEAARDQRQRDPTASGTAYTWFLRGRAAWRDGNEKQALQHLNKATEIDPQYARAHAYAAYFYAYGEGSQTTGLSMEETHRNALNRITLALAVDRSDPFVLQRASMVYLLVGEPVTGLRYAEAAARMNPRDAEILIIHGMCLLYCGELKRGTDMIEKAIALEPKAPPGFYSALSDCRYLTGDYEGSLDALDQILDEAYYLRLYRVPSLAKLGRLEEARAIVDGTPTGFDVGRFARWFSRICARPEDAERWLEGFRLAGIDV